QLLLELVSEQDVQRVRELIGIDADQAAADPREIQIDVLRVPFRTGDSEVLAEERGEVGHERTAAAHEHLEHERLALLECHAAVAPDGLIPPLLRQAEVVHRMTGLMQRPEKTREKVGAVETSRHADVAWYALGERVLALIEAAAVERETYRLHDLDGERALLACRKFSRERCERSALLQTDHFADERREPARESLEHPVDI